MHRLLRHVVYCLWVSGAVGDTQKTTSQEAVSGTSTRTEGGSVALITSLSTSSTSVATPSVSVNSTCPSRTVNYITHTLPQKCLRTDWVPHNSRTTTNTRESIVATAELNYTTPQSTTGDPYPTTVPSVEVNPEDTFSTTNTPESSTIPPLDAADGSSTIAEVTVAPHADEESDSPLDNANFLSFEEWKKQNLAKLGQSLEDVGRGQPVNPSRPRPVINNALEALGEEGEIELDFSGFGGSSQPPVQEDQTQSSSPGTGSSGLHQGSGSLSRSKDAGKTCKERTNYASFDCSATILKSNKECKSASAVLVENKDSYMLNTCSANNRFFIVQLCNDIQIDTIVLANYEFFSSSFRHFRVSVSDRYPVEMEKWRNLGTFEARNSREIQAFLIENPLIWAKYLRIEFLSHYGTEYYCPVSLLRVHGTTMIEDYRHEEDVARGELVEATLETEALATPAVAQEPVQSSDDSAKETAEVIPSVDAVISAPKEETSASNSHNSSSDVIVEYPGTQQPAPSTTGSLMDNRQTAKQVAKQVGIYEPSNSNMTCDDPVGNLRMAANTTSQLDAESTTGVPSNASNQVSATLAAYDETSHRTDTAANPAESVNPDTSLPAVVPPSTNQTEGDKRPAQSAVENNTSTSAESTGAGTSTASNVTNTPSSSPTNTTRNVASVSTNAQPAQPSTQESFFKSFHKRLQQLESNSTLSLKYIEEQSRILRDAFSKVEKRQVSSTTRFLSQLNETVMTELHGFRQAYDQLWQSTVIELEGQRETYQREMLALSSRLTLVADELVWQKRMGIVQSTLLLLCLALAVFGRSENGYLEMPLMQQMMNRSTQAFRGGWDSPPNSPSPESRSPVSLFRKRIWRAKTEPAGDLGQLTDSETSRPQSKEGPEVLVESPSPTQDPQSDYEDIEGDDALPNVEQRGKSRREQSSSPKRSRKKPKKWLSGQGPNGRMKSPLAL